MDSTWSFCLSDTWVIEDRELSLRDCVDFTLCRRGLKRVELSETSLVQIRASQKELLTLLEKRIPIYGVNTGFGDSCFRIIPIEKVEQLQANLVSYLLCGTGNLLSRERVRATLLFRFVSLSRGLSGVSEPLLVRLMELLNRDWVPPIPCKGSLGASGDLVPLAYVAQAVQGEGSIDWNGKLHPAKELFSTYGLGPYKLKPKEGLALVNGTSAMAGVALVNWVEALSLLDLSAIGTSWLCLALGGRTESFGPLVNARAKNYSGQSRVAAAILELLQEEDYQPIPLSQIRVQEGEAELPIQDRYSLRCVPQILGPMVETLDLTKHWLTLELNGVSDNPLVSPEGGFATGGNFYGGYLSHSMDYVKICLANLADLLDRQVASLVDEKSNRGLHPNLANWESIPLEERFLHHGLKGIHQSMSALASEMIANSMPNSVFSRSAESHNQDKVSLGMSAANQCTRVLEECFLLTSYYMVCVAQALDLKKINLKGEASRSLFHTIRSVVPFVERDQPLGEGVERLAATLREKAYRGESFTGVFGEIS